MRRKIISKYYRNRIEQGFVLRLECDHTIFVKWGAGVVNLLVIVVLFIEKYRK